jgi:hypothetical protein
VLSTRSVTLNQRVGGSIPSAPTNPFKDLVRGLRERAGNVRRGIRRPVDFRLLCRLDAERQRAAEGGGGGETSIGMLRGGPA